MKCENCGASMFDKMLHRTKPTGKLDAGWMCIDCIGRKEPELADNIKSDDDYKVMQIIEETAVKTI